MGLLFRIFKGLYLIGLTIIKASLIDDSYYDNKLRVWLANFLTILALMGLLLLVLYLFVWAISLEIFVGALLLAYLEALLWQELADGLTSLVREICLVWATVGYTVLIGAVIQIDRMPRAGSTALVIYWTFLLVLGLLLWRIAIGWVTESAGYQPELKLKKIVYKQQFRSTNIEEIPIINQAQAYLKRMR